MSTKEVMDELTFEIADALEGTGLTFALVMWLPGRAADEKAMGVLVAEPGEPELQTAFSTASRVTLR
jgi:hypothetical protein